MTAGLRHLAQALARAAGERPDGTALEVHGLRAGSPVASLSYSELAFQAAAFAGALRARGVRPGDRVPLAVDKDIDGHVALWGVLWAGAAYVPMDLRWPVRRLAQVCQLVGARHWVCEPRTADALEAELKALESTPLPEAVDPSTRGETLASPVPADLAYILMTSGSTGVPKAVAHSHQSALAFATWAAEEVGLTRSDRVAGHASWTFDLSTFDLFSTALAAATALPVPAAASFHGHGLAAALDGLEPTVWYSVPLVWHRMQQALGGNFAAHVGQHQRRLRAILFAGERFGLPALRKLAEALPDTRLLNLYGPTETNVCTFHEVSAQDLAQDAPLPIGRAAAGARLASVRGQLRVSGPTLMAGYWGAEEDGLVVWGTNDAARAYDTGDRVTVDKDGRWHLLGRDDDQVKLRGHRLELGEVANALERIEGVSAAAAAVVDGRLLAGVRTSGHRHANLERHARTTLKASLPAWAVPEAVVALAELPRTPNGKLDRGRLAKLLAEACP